MMKGHHVCDAVTKVQSPCPVYLSSYLLLQLLLPSVFLSWQRRRCVI